MTRFHWTTEPFGYALRDTRGYSRALVTRPKIGEGYYGLLFQPGLPDAGPYKNRQDAANWVTGMLVRLELVPADSVFQLLPPWTQPTREEMFAE